ncbi:MAG: MltA domain-containing protein, partial [Hyphomicrobiales bacterium]|nr:MltA domain-containing protein [Hyphomicrobiales bacterium]
MSSPPDRHLSASARLERVSARAKHGEEGARVASTASSLLCRPSAFHELRNWDADDTLAAFAAFKAGAAAMADGRPPLRAARAPSASLVAIGKAALSQSPRDGVEARVFFETHFAPFEIFPDAKSNEPERPFFTGYFEPVTDGSTEQSAGFQAPILARPADLVTLARGERLKGRDVPLTSARRMGRRLVPFPDRPAIEAGALAGQGLELVWLKDRVEVFIIQVQGSAQVRLTDGRRIRLRYDGRNGWPYTSIGRLLIEEGAIQSEQMSLETLTSWLRDHPENAETIMRRNRSYVFFAIEDGMGEGQGPVGGANVPLTPGRSLA